jgi:hypothetical protein
MAVGGDSKIGKSVSYSLNLIASLALEIVLPEMQSGNKRGRDAV